jgi:Tfp pilus assembly protein PilF
MKSFHLMLLSLSLLMLGSGCQHAATPSLAMQQKFFASLKNSSPEEEKALRYAQYYKLVGRFDLAAKELSSAVTQDPHNVRLLNALGSCYDRLGDYAKAKEIYQRVLSQDAVNPQALNNLGYSCYLAGDLEQAERKFQEVLTKDPGNTLAQNNLGLLWCRQGKDQKALSFWQKTEGDIAAQEKLTQVLAHLGKPMERTGIGANDAKTSLPQIPEARNGGEDKPDKKIRQPEIAQGEKSSVPARSASLAAVVVEPTSIESSKVTRAPEKVSQEAKQTVSEREVAIQPASFTRPESANENLLAVLNPATKEPASARTPATVMAGKLPPGSNPKLKKKESLVEEFQSDEDSVESRPNPHYYRPKQWVRQWKPKIVVYNPPEPQKPQKSIKDYIFTGETNRNQNATTGAGAVVY